jgi:hypothetical protein
MDVMHSLSAIQEEKNAESKVCYPCRIKKIQTTTGKKRQQ